MQIHIAAGATVNINGVPASDITAEMISLPVRSCICPASAAIGAQDTPAFGELWPGQGGYYAGILPAIGDRPAQHLIVSAQEAEGLTWGPYTEVEGARSRHDGRANTKALMDAGGKDFAKDFPAAWWCSDLEIGPMSDFHLPSQAELFLASLYAPQLFNKEGWYWSSTQNSRYSAFVQDFEGGDSGWDVKGSDGRVRAFRWIPLTA
jgi:hypothetical protein